MKRLKLIDQSILYRNPHPGHEVISAVHPAILPLSNDELLCFYRAGQAVYSLDGEVNLLRSTDGGRTWTQEGAITDGRNEPGGPFTYGTAWATRHRDGTIYQQACRWPARRETMIRFNPETGGHRPDQQAFRRSTDNGRTWSPPEISNVSLRQIADSHGSIHELDDGRWMQIFETWKDFDDPGPLHIKSFALFSGDRGKTWGDRIDIPSGNDPVRMYSHTQHRRMRDGRLVATQWTQDIGGQVDHDLHLVFCDPTGRAWNKPATTGLMGQSSCVIEAREGVLVVTYSLRVGRRPGVMVALSLDEGRTWDVKRQARIWDAVGQEFLGVEHKPAYPASHDNIAFGKPDTAVLARAFPFSP